MLKDLIPFTIHFPAQIFAGAGLWSLALYLGLNGVKEWLIEQLFRWFNFAERSLYTSQDEFERTREVRESQNAFYASVFSIIPFLVIGILCHLGLQWGLGGSWSVSLGIMACFASGVYELGRTNEQRSS